MLPPLATLAQFEARIARTLTDQTDIDRANALLEDASSLVRFEAGEDWVDEAGALAAVPDVATTITLSASVRAWYNPAQVQSEQLGAAMVRFGDVWLTGAEADRLRRLGDDSTLHTVELTGGFGFDGTPFGYAPCDNNDDGATVPYADWVPIGY
jgi:hypothetical protein